MLAIAYLLSALVCAAIGVVAFRRRHVTSAAVALSVAMAGLTWWSGVDLVSTFVGSPQHVVAVLLAIYPGVSAVVVGCFCLCRSVADRDWCPTRCGLALLCVEPVLVTLAAATNPLHHLMVRSLTGTSSLTFGPLFWLHSLYSYALLSWALFFVLRERRHAPALRTRQLTTLLVAAVIPTVGNIVTILGLSGIRDVSAIFFVATGLLDAHAVFRQGLFEVVPIARARVLERLHDAVVVLDEQDRLGDVNAAGLALLARADPPGRPTTGSPAADALGGLAEALLDGSGGRRVQLCDAEVDLDVSVTPLEDGRGRPIGRILVVRDVTDDSRARRELAAANQALTDQLATIEQLRAEVQEQALRDPLTGLHNRRHLTAVLDELTRRHEQDAEPLSVVLLDVDHFKDVNDRHGHGVGDRLLQCVAQQLQASVRDADIVARFGGEEFVVVLPGLDLVAASERCEQIRTGCADVVLPVPGGRVRITMSAGVASTGPGVSSPYALLEVADQALYRAKAGGRDQASGLAVTATPLAS